MKKLLIIFMLLVGKAHGQQIEITDSTQLGAMTKVQLAQVYIQEVQRVTREMAFLTFDSVAAEVPTTKYTMAKFKKVKAKVDAYNEMLYKEFLEIIPYADKAEIIQSISYMKQF